MSKDFVKLQAIVLATIADSPLNDSELGLLWADRYGGTPRTLEQRVRQWRSYGLPRSIMLIVELLDILGYKLKIEKRGKE